ncbi:MAG: GNAT family N-acetyltransferase [Chloroherpetonaceae bacterium]|nr:GNAT family N-acetyltransferase [Chloroherpetonaceae bacterium]
MPEFGAIGSGFAIMDKEVDEMYETYQLPRSRNWVIENPQTELILGGGGIAPLQGAAETICELKKMYFYREIRGKGFGSLLIRRALDEARSFGFKGCYLETLTQMEQAQKLYQKFGFKKLDRPMGNTGHFGCNQYFYIDL